MENEIDPVFVSFEEKQLERILEIIESGLNVEVFYTGNQLDMASQAVARQKNCLEEIDVIIRAVLEGRLENDTD